MPHVLRKIPLRMMNRPVAVASVIDHCAAWHCACGHAATLQGRSGPSFGPTPESVVTCQRCHRVYFVIPEDRSFGPPIEVVELFEAPATEPAPSGEAGG